MAVRWTWRDEAFRRLVAREAADRLESAAIVVERKAIELVSEPFPPASKPGEPPRDRSGKLGESITHRMDRGGLLAQIGVFFGSPAYRYASLLEFGSRGLEARPFLRPALVQSKPEIRRIMRRG